MQYLFGTYILIIEFNKWRKCRWKQAGPVGDGAALSVLGTLFNELHWPTLEVWKDQSFVILHKVYCWNMSIDKAKYMPLSQIKTH